MEYEGSKVNKRLSPKERGLIKGAIRRVFSRSELRRQVLKTAVVEHTDPNRPRVKTWYQCRTCCGYFAQYEMEVDHISPVIKIDETLEDLSWDTVIDRQWCDMANLQVVCRPCHASKSKEENRLRRAHKKGKIK